MGTGLLFFFKKSKSPAHDYYRDVFGFRISPKNIRLGYYIGANIRKLFPNLLKISIRKWHFRIDISSFFFGSSGIVPVRKNKKAAVRRKIRFLVPSSEYLTSRTDQDRVPDFPNQRIFMWNLESRNARRACGRWYQFSGGGERA